LIKLFDILYETQFAIDHGGQNSIMVSELKNKYCNITNETFMVYLKLCKFSDQLIAYNV